METTDDFVVVDEDAGSAKKLEIDRLRVLVELFTKALDTLNQSNVLLKDELQSALSVTLQHVCPDRSSSTDDLIKLLDNNVSSPDEVRANYVKRLCSRLVAINEEKMALLAENTSLRESLSSKEKEFSDQVADASLTTRNIEMVVSQLEDAEPNPPEIVSASTTIGDLCTSLNAIYERLLKLKLKPPTEGKPEAPGNAVRETQSTPRTMVSAGALAAEVHDVPTPTDLPPPPAYPDRTETEVTERMNPQVPLVEEEDDLHEFGLPSPQDPANEIVPPMRVQPERTEGAGRGTPQPSYSAIQEEPWCPCCQQRFASRDELETHLLSCLT